jgi:hypothetical protein
MKSPPAYLPAAHLKLLGEFAEQVPAGGHGKNSCSLSSVEDIRDYCHEVQACRQARNYMQAQATDIRRSMSYYSARHWYQGGRYTTTMQLTLELPDELSAALAASGQDLSRAVFEAVALEAYRERKLSTAQLRRLLGFESRYELDGFLKRHEVWLEYTWEDVEQDLETHHRLGL